jgi:hypothetical protein
MPIPQVNDDDEYGLLPTPIQMRYTREQYAWLSDEEKLRLIDNETEPEPE